LSKDSVLKLIFGENILSLFLTLCLLSGLKKFFQFTKKPRKKISSIPERKIMKKCPNDTLKLLLLNTFMRKFFPEFSSKE